MKTILNPFALAAALLLCSQQFLSAQLPGGNVSPFSPAVLKVFGNQTNFTANTELLFSDGSTKLEGKSKMSVLDGKVRTELDIAKMKGESITPEGIAQMKQMGTDKNTIIMRPDKGVTYMVFPSLSAYLETPLTEAEKESLKKEPKVTITALGKETIDGHPCVKNKVVISDDNGKAQEMTVWNASDLKNFPAQIEMKEKEAAILTKFKNVDFAKPDAKQFDPPSGYKKYSGMQELQQVIMEKMMATPTQN